MATVATKRRRKAAATPVAADAAPVPLSAERRVLLPGVRWQTYEMLLRDLAERPVRMTFDRGSLEIMAPSFRHEDYSVLLGQFIRVLAQEFRLPFKSARTTTFRHPDVQRGLEADECFYLENLPRVLGKQVLDVQVDPPPDLAVEVEIWPGAVDRMEIYAALRVPQVWRFTDTLRMFCLRAEGSYEEVVESPTFPGVSPAMLVTFLKQGLTMDETSLMEAFRDWVRREVLSRGKARKASPSKRRRRRR